MYTCTYMCYSGYDNYGYTVYIIHRDVHKHRVILSENKTVYKSTRRDLTVIISCYVKHGL